MIRLCTQVVDGSPPHGEVNLAWQCSQQLHSSYHAAEQDRKICQKVGA
jgi:hypothetical protein